jgi:hypothetical protein
MSAVSTVGGSGEVVQVDDTWNCYVVEYQRPGVDWRPFRHGEFDSTGEAAEFMAGITVDVPMRVVHCVGSSTETRTVVAVPPAASGARAGEAAGFGDHLAPVDAAAAFITSTASQVANGRRP